MEPPALSPPDCCHSPHTPPFTHSGLGNNTGLMCSTCVPEDGRPRQSFTDSECQDCLDMGVAAVVVLAAILGFAVVTGILVWIYMYPPEWGLEFSRLMHILSDAAQACLHAAPLAMRTPPLW
eukprot:802048-Prymnesium_polylepis.3